MTNIIQRRFAAAEEVLEGDRVMMETSVEFHLLQFHFLPAHDQDVENVNKWAIFEQELEKI